MMDSPFTPPPGPPPPLTPAAIAILERLGVLGFLPATFPLYASAIGVRRGAFAALLVTDPATGLRLLGEPSYLIEGQLSARARRGGRDCFVWKQKQVEASPAILSELRQFAADLAHALAPKPAAEKQHP
jgi:hypothetical protein